MNLHLGNFEVPVAKLVPHELVNAAGHVVQPVLGKALGHIGLHALQSGGNPAVSLRKRHVTVRWPAGLALGLGVFLQAAVLAFAVHQDKAGRVPELVAKVAVALAALAVKVDAAAQAVKIEHTLFKVLEGMVLRDVGVRVPLGLAVDEVHVLLEHLDVLLRL